MRILCSHWDDFVGIHLFMDTVTALWGEASYVWSAQQARSYWRDPAPRETRRPGLRLFTAPRERRRKYL